MKIIDKFSRTINYLRISITDRCNLKCIYCVPDDIVPNLTHNDILRYEEILHIVKIAVNMGISKVRITGGEPLVRKGVYGFFENLCSIKGLQDVSLTTNGLVLKDNIEKIKNAGIKRINISLDTLKKDRFEQITGTDGFNSVWDGIMLSLEKEFKPVKINIVALNGINEDEFEDIAKLSFLYPLNIRFIEYMPMGKSRFNRLNIKKQLLAPEIKKRISRQGELIPLPEKEDKSPARIFKFSGAKGTVGFITPLSEHFCCKCNRLRLTASGRLRPCLLSDKSIDIKKALRSGKDYLIATAFLKAAAYKKAKHNLKENFEIVNGRMYAIGG